MLTFDLEMGREVLIPKELNVKEMSSCFQYYDCILQTIAKKITPEQKIIIQKQNKYSKIIKYNIKDIKKNLFINT